MKISSGKLVACLLMGAVGACSTVADEPKPGNPETEKKPAFPDESNGWTLISAVTHSTLKESSGLAPSGVLPSVIWSHNDGGAGALFFAIDTAKGSVRQIVSVPDTPNLDWEDLFVVRDGKRRLLAVADVGDNEKRRKSCAIHLFQEATTGEGETGALELVKVRTILFAYPEGKRFDAEAAAFDPQSGDALILTKSKSGTLLFQVPLDKAANADETPFVARLAGTLTPPGAFPKREPLVTLKRGIFGTSCTSADVSPNGNLLAVLTYTDCFLYRKATDESWATAVAREPRLLPLPSIYQAEALCFSADGASLIVSSENSPVPLYRIAVPPPQAAGN